MNVILQYMIDLIYPRRCPICGDIVLPKGNLICKDCYEDLPLITEPRCKKCSKPIAKEEQELCYDCKRHTFHYTYGYALWVYNDELRKSIVAFKYKYKAEYASFYVEELLKYYDRHIRRMGVEVIVPVPIHKTRLKQRGYNQAALLAKGIADGLGIPMEEHLLVRTKKTVAQKRLNDQERFRNLQHAFLVNPERICAYKGKKVLLVDDIYTTGSTIETCTKAMLDAGIKEVYFISLCIGRGY